MMSETIQVALSLIQCLVIPLFIGGIKFMIRVEKKLTKIETKLGIDGD
jgi:hypothetical protein